jgi:glucose-1-phosphate thymidylyltransferase
LKAIVLAGGYATRLYPLTKYVPKPLLPVDGIPIIDYIIDKIENLGSIERIIVSANNKFGKQFCSWLQKHSTNQNIELEIEKSEGDWNKPGAIGALASIWKKHPSDDYLVVAGDNLFTDTLSEFLSFYLARRATSVALYPNDSQQSAGNFGSVEINSEGRIVKFVEKPVSASTRGSLIATSIYLIPAGDMKRMDTYIGEGNNTDSPGYFIQWLSSKHNVYGYQLKGRWWDIGTIDSYNSVKDLRLPAYTRSGSAAV